MHRDNPGNDPGNDHAALKVTRRAQTVAASFDQAADDYDHNAHFQSQVAANLARRIRESSLPMATRRVLEIGCGTGLLTEHLIGPYGVADWTITDISPRMIDRCRQKIQAIESDERPSSDAPQAEEPRGQRDYQVMNAQALCVAVKFDLICSSLVFQWFPNLLEVVIAMVDHLQPGGALVFNTLGADSFRYWRNLDQQVGGPPSAHLFPTFATITNELRTGCHRHFGEHLKVETETEAYEDRYPNFLEFLRSLKIIGAGTPMGDRPVSLSQLRSVLRQSRQEDSQGVLIDYQVITVIIQKP